MTELRTKVLRQRYRLKHDLFSFDDVVLMVALGLCFIFTWGAISSMSRNWSLAQEVANRQRAKAVLELEVETLELENAYYLSDEYQELAARKYQGKKLPGETMVYLPPNSETAKNQHQPDAAPDAAVTVATMSNFEQWLKFLFGF